MENFQVSSDLLKVISTVACLLRTVSVTSAVASTPLQ